MRRILELVVVALAIGLVGIAAGAAAGHLAVRGASAETEALDGRTVEAEEAVRAAILAHWEAIGAGDTEAVLRRHDVRLTAFLPDEGPLRTVDSHEEQHASLAGLEGPASGWAVRDLVIDVYGDVAVAAFHLEARGAGAGAARRCTEVWALREGEWREVHHHDSPLLAGALP